MLVHIYILRRVCLKHVRSRYRWLQLKDLDNFTSHSPAEQGDPDVLASSQLGGAPLGYSQQQTPQPSLRPQRQMRSLDRHTYSQGHVHAQQRTKRVRHHRGG